MLINKKPLQNLEKTYIQYLKNQQEAQLTITKSPGASINVVKDSKLFLQHHFGVRSVSTGEPVTAHTLFRLGSLSKGFTGILVAILHEKGIIDLEKSVLHYLPCLSKRNKEAFEKIKLYHLLSHSSGIPPHAYTLDVERGVLPFDLCDKFEPLVEENSIGNHFYQNAFFALIEHVIEQATGKTFIQSMKEELSYLIMNPMLKTRTMQYLIVGTKREKNMKWRHSRKNTTMLLLLVASACHLPTCGNGSGLYLATARM